MSWEVGEISEGLSVTSENGLLLLRKGGWLM